MKNILILIVGIISSYLLWGFISNNYNISSWSEPDRLIFIAFTMLISGFLWFFNGITEYNSMKQIKNLNIHCGYNTDSQECLEALCKKEIKHLSKTLKISKDNNFTVTFWTKDLPSELICIGILENNGLEVKYSLDFNESTL